MNAITKAIYAKMKDVDSNLDIIRNMSPKGLTRVTDEKAILNNLSEDISTLITILSDLLMIVVEESNKSKN